MLHAERHGSTTERSRYFAVRAPAFVVTGIVARGQDAPLAHPDLVLNERGNPRFGE